MRFFPVCRYSQYADGGGPAARSLKPKLDALSRLVSSRIGGQQMSIDVCELVTFFTLQQVDCMPFVFTDFGFFMMNRLR